MTAMALLGLLLLQDPDVDTLINQLSDESIEVRDKAAAALIELGADEVVRKHAASAVGEVKARCEGILRAIATRRKLTEVLPPPRKVTIEAKDSGLRDVLESLRRQSGMAMRLEGIGDVPVTIRIKDAAPLEALNAICKAADITYVIDRNLRQAGRPAGVVAAKDWAAPSIRFQSGGYVDAPRVFVRNYAIGPTALNINKWTDFKTALSSATLQLRLAWTPETKPESAGIELDSVTDDKGRSLFTRPKPAGGLEGRMPGSGIHRWQTEQSFQLSIPEGDAKSIASLRGTARLSYRKEEKSVRFDKPEESVGQKREYDGLSIELKSYQPDPGSARIMFGLTGKRENAGVEPQALVHVVNPGMFRITTEDGSSIGPAQIRQGGGWCELTCTNVWGKITSLEIILEVVYLQDTFDFELKNIPLPK